MCNHSVAGDYDLRCISALLATSCHRPPAHHKICYPCGGYKAYQFCFVVTSADPLRLGRLPRCDTAALRCQDQQWFQLCLLTSAWLHSRGQFLVSTPLGASARPENALHTYADPPHTYFKASLYHVGHFPPFLLFMSAFLLCLPLSLLPDILLHSKATISECAFANITASSGASKIESFFFNL